VNHFCAYFPHVQLPTTLTSHHTISKFRTAAMFGITDILKIFRTQFVFTLLNYVPTDMLGSNGSFLSPLNRKLNKNFAWSPCCSVF